MLYDFLANAVIVIHLGFVVFVAVGGFVAWRYPRILVAHGPAVAWALGIVTVGWSCPLTGVENNLRERAGRLTYDGGFVDRYLTGVLYPTEYEQLMQALVAAGVTSAYVPLIVRWRRSRMAMA